MMIQVPRLRSVSLLAGGLAALTTLSAAAQPALPPVPVPTQNPITPAKRVLGKILFWDAQLSSDNTTACGSCHEAGAGGLTDPRVEAETFPFNRPTLHTELPPNPSVTGSGTPGTGGVVPAIIAVTPPNLGNTGFKVGIDRALGGAAAYVALFRNPPGAGEEPMDVHGPIVLDGEGPGGGYGTWHWSIPGDPALRGDEVFVRWRVVDPGAPNGIALSPVARLSFYEADPTSCGCTGDLDCNGVVGFGDLVAVLGAWGGCALCAADVNDDGIVGMDDLIGVLSAWGTCAE